MCTHDLTPSSPLRLESLRTPPLLHYTLSTELTLCKFNCFGLPFPVRSDSSIQLLLEENIKLQSLYVYKKPVVFFELRTNFIPEEVKLSCVKRRSLWVQVQGRSVKRHTRIIRRFQKEKSRYPVFCYRRSVTISLLTYCITPNTSNARLDYVKSKRTLTQYTISATDTITHTAVARW